MRMKVIDYSGISIDLAHSKLLQEYDPMLAQGVP